MRDSRPWLTAVVFAGTATSTALGLSVPAVTDALARDRAFLHGQWWRLVTPVLVNPEGWQQVGFNLVALLVVGVLAERVFGRAGWAVLYLTGALAGEVFSYATANYSAGSSVAIAGLFGGLLVWVVSGRAGLAPPPRLVAGLMLAGAVVLMVIRDEHGAPILAGAALGTLLLRRRRPVPAAGTVEGREPASR